MNLNCIKKVTALILAAFLTTGCTATFTYNQLDWLIPWWVDSYMDITREQRRLLQDQLEPALKWHREEELARYDQWLAEIEAGIGTPVTQRQVRGWIEEVIAAAERIEESMLQVAVDFGATVSDGQMEEFIDNMWEKQREYEDEFLSRSDQEYVDDNADSLSEFSSKVAGKLTPEQRETLRQTARSMRRFDTAWLNERDLWLQSLERLLQRKPGWQQAVMESWTARQATRTVEYRSILDHNLATISAGFAGVLNGMDEKQQAHAFREIAKLRSKLAKLRNQGPPDR